MSMFHGDSLLAEHQVAAAAGLTRTLGLYGGAVLADEPGLGKSFVAAEVARLQSLAGTDVEVVVPSSLVAQWQETLATFAVPALVVTHGALPSMKPPVAGRRLMIVDEAHAFRNPATLRYAALARRSVGARLLLVTATPVCNSAGDLAALLRLIVCDDALAPCGVPSIDLAFANRERELLEIIIDALLVRRGKGILPSRLAFGELKREVVSVPPPGAEVDRLLDELEFPLVEGAPLVRAFLRRRLDSSEAAILESLRRQERFYERALECLAAGRTLPKRDYRRAFSHEEDAAAFQTVLFWDFFVPVGSPCDPAKIHQALAQIAALRHAVERLPRLKEQALVRLCRSVGEPLLVYTGWTATARSLADVLQMVRRTTLVSGRQLGNAEAIDAFRRGRVDILVSTDVGAEGLNLQRAGVVIHYDLPWNPVRVDQRNGRAHRIGQRRESVRAIYFLPDRRRDTVVQTVAGKNRVRRRLLGGETRPAAQALPPAASMRPRVAADAAVVRVAEAAARSGVRLPAALERRHRAGVELILREMAREHLGSERLREIEQLLEREWWARSHGG